MSINNKDLEQSLNDKVDTLEQMIDCITPTPLRHYLNDKIVHCRLALRNFDQEKYESDENYLCDFSNGLNGMHREKEDNPMKTKIDVLKGIHVVNPETKAVLTQAISALSNPLGVLPGDVIEVSDIGKNNWLEDTFLGFSGDIWRTATEYWKFARLPVITQDVTFKDVDIEQLREWRRNLHHGTAIQGMKDLIDAYFDEEGK